MIERYDLSGTQDQKSLQLLLVVQCTRNSPYVIELYSVLVECLRFNMHRILHPSARPGHIKRYTHLVGEITRRGLLPKSLVRLLRSFYDHRNRVIHDIMFNRNFTGDDLDRWYEEGMALNTRLLSEIGRTKTNSDQYDMISFTPGFNI